MKIIFYLFMVFTLLEMAQALDQDWSKALALAQKDDKKKKDAKKGKDKKGKKPKKGGKKGGKGGGGGDGGGDDGDGDDAGGDDAGGDDDDQLSYEALSQMVEDFSEKVLSLKTESSEKISDRLKEIEDENIEFIEQIRDWFNEENKIVQENSQEMIQKLRSIVLKNQLSTFAFTQTLLDKKKDDHEHQITLYKQQIQEMMKKFPPPKSACDLIQDCESCLQRHNCIWCSESESCREGNVIDGAYFWSCPYILSQTCETPKSDHFFRLPPLKESQGKFFDFSTDPDMPLEQKQFLMRKQAEILSVKQQIEKKRLQLTQMQNITIMIRAKHIQLSFYINQLEKDPSIEDAEMDAGYEEFFLDVIDADDVKEAVEQLEDNVEQMREEDVEANQEQFEQEQQAQEDLLESRRRMYEGQSDGNSRADDKPKARAKQKNDAPTLSGNSKESLEDMLNNQKNMEKEKKKNNFFW